METFGILLLREDEDISKFSYLHYCTFKKLVCEDFCKNTF